MWTSEPLAEIYPNTPEHPMISIDGLKSLRIHNRSNITISYLNVNSIRRKFDDLKLTINADILCIAETKIDEIFPTGQVLYISDKQGGLIIYIKPIYPLDYYKTIFHLKIYRQLMPFELNLRDEK